jgi:hypothetical protein
MTTTTEYRPWVYHTFRGGRFEDHGVVLDALEDLLRYRDLLVSVAKALWRRRNPDCERPPKNFEDSLSLKFYEVQPKCATIPLVRVVPSSNEKTLFPIDDELDEALSLVTRTVEAAGLDQRLPEEFPEELLGLFDCYGRTLREDEWIEQRPADRETPVRYDARTRERLTGPVGRSSRVHQVDQATLLPGGEVLYDPNAKPFWEEFDEIMAEVPPEELEKLPRDGAAQLDHYLYGSPKK